MGKLVLAILFATCAMTVCSAKANADRNYVCNKIDMVSGIPFSDQFRVVVNDALTTASVYVQRNGATDYIAHTLALKAQHPSYAGKHLNFQVEEDNETFVTSFTMLDKKSKIGGLAMYKWDREHPGPWRTTEASSFICKTK